MNANQLLSEACRNYLDTLRYTGHTVATQELGEACNVSEQATIDGETPLDYSWLNKAFPDAEMITDVPGPEYLLIEFGNTRASFTPSDSVEPARFWFDGNAIEDPRRWHVRQLAGVFGIPLGAGE